jgi:Xaa-Pro dipeptidase
VSQTKAGETIHVDVARMRRDRLERTLEQLREHGIAAALLFDPNNIRYATFDMNASVAVYALHNVDRWALVPVDSDPIVWEPEPHHPALKLSAAWDGEIRAAGGWRPTGAGRHSADKAAEFAAEISATLRELGLAGELIGIDRADAVCFFALQEAGVRMTDAQLPLELARAVKTPEELNAHRLSARACDAGISALRERLRPGVTENELWAAFNAGAFELGAEYNETRLLASGPRTNPWYQEASSRVVEEGDLVAFDTDLVGNYGYITDVSRTYLCGDREPTDEQRRLHAIAFDFMQKITALCRPGASFEDLGAAGRNLLPKEFHALVESEVVHGCGLGNGYPAMFYTENYEGEIEVDMVLSVEAYVGEVGGHEGVKLEEQFAITESGIELFSQAPFEERLL